MPVEPPVVSPRTLAEAYAVLAEGPIRPIAGGTDLMVALTGELGEPPGSDPRPVAARRAARDRGRWRFDQSRGADDLHRHPPVGGLSRASPRVGRGGRDDRRGPDPESRDARRQRRQRLAGRRHAAGPAGRRRHVRARLGPRRALGPGERVLAGLPADGAGAGRAPAAHPDPARWPAASCASARSGRAAPSRSARSSWPSAGATPGRRDRGPTSASRSGRWRPPPSGRPLTEAAIEGRPPTPETADRAAETLADELHPIDDVRSTAEYRRLVAARVLHRLIREAGGW